MDVARVAGLGAVGKALRDIEGLNIADDRRSVNEMEADRRVREELPLGRIDHVCRGRDESAGLAFEGELLGLERVRRKHGGKSKAGHKPAEGTEECHFSCSNFQLQ